MGVKQSKTHIQEFFACEQCSYYQSIDEVVYITDDINKEVEYYRCKQCEYYSKEPKVLLEEITK